MQCMLPLNEDLYFTDLDTTLRNLLSTMIKKMYDTVTEYLVTGDFQRQSAI